MAEKNEEFYDFKKDTPITVTKIPPKDKLIQLRGCVYNIIFNVEFTITIGVPRDTALRDYIIVYISTFKGFTRGSIFWKSRFAISISSHVGFSGE